MLYERLPWKLRKSLNSLLSGKTTFLGFLLITSLPILSASNLWRTILAGSTSRAWDGTGHFAIAQLYSQLNFPDTFGWTNAYFGGMPFPNFYPPLFYWCVALLTRIVSFANAFKFLLLVPVILIPVGMSLLAQVLANKDWLVPAFVGLATAVLLIDSRFLPPFPAGLDYFSTFQVGLYSQPLGYLLLIAWYGVYSRSEKRFWRVILSSILLALTVLASFFNAITATMFVVATLMNDAANSFFIKTNRHDGQEKHILLAHVLSPFIAMCLASFWLAPAITGYAYFVTRPHMQEGPLVSRMMWAWYGLAMTSLLLFRRQQTRASLPYFTTCFLLGALVVFSGVIAPRWFPLQSARFLATLNFLLALPVGYALAAGFRSLASLLGEVKKKDQTLTLRRTPYTAAVALVLGIVLFLSASQPNWDLAFYPTAQKEPIEQLLEFAGKHNDGRYLVEVINPLVGPAWTEASFDARALNSYLGAQGNETISGVFHEASPNSLFTLPVVNTFSNYPDSFGISSVLADDLDFVAQPLVEHVKRAQFLGVKYFVIRTPAMKDRIVKEFTSHVKHDLGWWSVFELPIEPIPKVQALPYKPVLVISDFTVKARRRNEMSFIRLAEEQFADNWFEVMLVRSPESRIDKLADLDKFGALIIDKYYHDDEEVAFKRLQAFAMNRLLICLSSDNPLFRRIQNAKTDFSRLEIIDRQSEESGEIVETLHPSYRYNSSLIRQQWKTVRAVLDSNKIPTTASASEVAAEITHNNIKLRYVANDQSDPVPVFITTTFHPNWQRTDGARIYAATPFYMLTFVDKPTILTYSRGRLEKVGIWVSGITLCLLWFWIGFCVVKSIVSRYWTPLNGTGKT